MTEPAPPASEPDLPSSAPAAPASAPGDEGSLAKILQAKRENYEPLIREPETAAAVLASDTPRSRSVFVESVIVTLALPAIGWLIDRNDPFLLGHPFPWIVFPPLLLGLRHGFAAGCASALLLGCSLVAAWRARTLGVAAFPAEPFLGLLAMAILTGQFSDVWRRDTGRLGSMLDQVKRRSSELARAHFLLELSHGRLEDQNASAPNLRDALATVGKIAAGARGEWEAIGERMMAIFAAYAMLEVGKVLRIDARSQPAGVVATLGRTGPVDESDVLLVEAVRSRELTYIPTGASAKQREIVSRSRLLAAVPFVDTTGALHAVLCVQAMPFVAFQKKNLETLAILAGHFADVLTRPSQRLDPERERKAEFDTRLARALLDLRAFGVPAVVAGLWTRRDSGVFEIIDVIIGGTLRPIDLPFRTEDPLGNSLFFFLVPMADLTAARALYARVETIVRRELNTSLVQAGGAFTFHVIRPDDTVGGVVHRVSQQVRGAYE